MKQANFATFLIITFIFVLAWTGFTIYHSFTTSSISPELQQAITPINSNFDQKTITDISNRKTVEALYDTTTASVSAVPTVTPPVVTTTTPTASGTSTLIPSVTPGGTP